MTEVFLNGLSTYIMRAHEPERIDLESTKTGFYAQKDTFNQLLVSYNSAVLDY